MAKIYAGIMSGTSMDGIDCVFVSFRQSGAVELHHHGFAPFPPQVRKRLTALLADPDPKSPLAKQIDHELGILYADAVTQNLQTCPLKEIAAIGCHGQTIIHCPDANPPYSWQIGDGSVIADRTGLPVVVDFRSADMRAGGEGAPLAPSFHNFAFRSDSQSRAVVNIGGISNVTFLPAEADGPVIGFDTGPGNALLDQWIHRNLNLTYDDGGQWAKSEPADEALLACLLDDPYFEQPIPKSLDCRYFSMDWLDDKLSDFPRQLEPAVVQSTLTALTADSIWFAIQSRMPDVKTIYLCGGGARNLAIVDHLRANSMLDVFSTERLGIPPDMVEACAFAWLAEQCIHNIPANITSVTGASRNVVLGSVVSPS